MPGSSASLVHSICEGVECIRYPYLIRAGRLQLLQGRRELCNLVSGVGAAGGEGWERGDESAVAHDWLEESIPPVLIRNRR